MVPSISAPAFSLALRAEYPLSSYTLTSSYGLLLSTAASTTSSAGTTYGARCPTTTYLPGAASVSRTTPDSAPVSTSVVSDSGS